MKAVIFDAGNTLVWLDHAYLAELLREQGVEASEEEIVAAEYGAKRLLDEKVRGGEVGTDESRGRVFFREIFRQAGLADDLFPAVAQRLYARHAERNLWSDVRERTAETLGELRRRGLKLGVISNADGRVEGLLESVGLRSYFDFVIDSALVGIEKPDPRIFRMGLERLGVEPEEAVYVGDIYEIDVAGARAAGMRAVLVDPLGRWTDLDCDRVAGIHELPAWLDGLPQAPPEAEWWNGYFDRTFVRIYRDFLTPERTAREVEGVREMLELPEGARILDLACGWGRHSIELARAGFRVTGLDFSETLLARARRRARAAAVEVEWVRGDMREPGRTGEFDAVLSMYSSLGYFLSDEEDLRVLRGAREALKPGGWLLLETMHRDHIVGGYAERDWWETDDGATVWVEREFDAVEGVSREWLRWRKGEEGGAKFHALRIRSATEWDALLRAAGFRPVDWYGDWELAPFLHSSGTLIVAARRGA